MEDKKQLVEVASKATRLFLGGVKDHISEASLRAHFDKICPVMSCDIMIDPLTKKRKGYAFLTVADQLDALRVLEPTTDHVIDGVRIDVKETIKRDKPTNTELREAALLNSRKIHINNVPLAVGPDKIKEFLSGFGKVDELIVMGDPKLKRFGYGFAVFEDAAVVQKLLHQKKATFCGFVELRFSHALSKQELKEHREGFAGQNSAKKPGQEPQVQKPLKLSAKFKKDNVQPDSLQASMPTMQSIIQEFESTFQTSLEQLLSGNNLVMGHSDSLEGTLCNEDTSPADLSLPEQGHLDSFTPGNFQDLIVGQMFPQDGQFTDAEFALQAQQLFSNRAFWPVDFQQRFQLLPGLHHDDGSCQNMAPNYSLPNAEWMHTCPNCCTPLPQIGSDFIPTQDTKDTTGQNSSGLNYGQFSAEFLESLQDREKSNYKFRVSDYRPKLSGYNI